MRHIRWYGPTLILLLTVLSIMVLGPRTVERLVFAQGDAEIRLARQQLQDTDVLAELSNSFRRVADSVKRSVVSIEILSHDDRDQRDMLREFFGPGLPDPRREREQDDDRFDQYDPPQQRGAGSGWVYDEQGHIITNYHVVANADEIRVRFSDGGTAQAEIVGSDDRTDIAVLSVDTNSLYPAAISDEPVEQGDMVFAFGSPFGFEFSVSQGIVSAKGRQLGIIGPGGYENFIQTDAAINRGNSGGPLTNIYGQVIGMNTAIASRTGMYSGLGFAIPSQMVRDVADQLIDTGQVRRGYLGIYIRDLTPQAAATFEGFEGEDGVLVDDPIPGGPAEEAGLRGDDIITAVGDEPVASADELRYLIADQRPGTTVELSVFRDGETITIEVTLDALPDRDQLSRGAPSPRPEQTQPDEQREGVQTLRKIGIERVRTFDERLAQQLNTDHRPGVLIQSVRRGSLADSRGLTRGMLITRVMQEPVSSVEDLVEVVEGYEPGRTLRFRVAQWDSTEERYRQRSVFLELPED